MKTFIKLVLITNLSLVAITPALAGQTIKEWMNDYYSDFDENTNCRYLVGGQAEEKYCIKLQQAKQVETKQGKRLYLLMTGNSVEETARAYGGLVGMFVFAPDSDISDGDALDKNNTWKVISAKSKIEMGSSGYAPNEWTFHKFAPNKWGFLTTTGYGMGGQFTEYFDVLTESGKSIQHNMIMKHSSYNDCEFSKVACYDLSAKIKINHKKVINGHHPLTLTVNGYDNETGKKYQNRKYQAIYKKGEGYVAEKGYPLSIE